VIFPTLIIWHHWQTSDTMTQFPWALDPGVRQFFQHRSKSMKTTLLERAIAMDC